MAGCALGFAVVAGFLVDSLGSDAVGGAVMGGVSLFFFHFRDRFLGFFFVFDGDEGGQEDGFLDFQFFLEGRPWGGVWDEHGFHSFSFDCTMGEAELGEGENNKTLQPQLCCVGMGVRIFFWTILVVLTLSLSFLCILLDSCRPR